MWTVIIKDAQTRLVNITRTTNGNQNTSHADIFISRLQILHSCADILERLYEQYHDFKAAVGCLTSICKQRYLIWLHWLVPADGGAFRQLLNVP